MPKTISSDIEVTLVFPFPTELNTLISGLYALGQRQNNHVSSPPQIKAKRQRKGAEMQRRKDLRFGISNLGFRFWWIWKRRWLEVRL
jgi:hypothetical protein